MLTAKWIVVCAIAALAAAPSAAVVTVRGAVQHQGAVTWKPGMTAAEAIKLAGGYADNAERAIATVRRTVNGRVVASVGRSVLTRELLPGDEIIVHEKAAPAAAKRKVA
jgi:protein involved in polysaccharide export with SLBB domain